MVISTKQNELFYGDSLQYPAPQELVDMLHWWLKHYQTKVFALQDLPSTHQKDSFSCGLLVINGLAHFFFPDWIPLIVSDVCDVSCVNTWIQIIMYIKEMVSIGFVAYINVTSMLNLMHIHVVRCISIWSDTYLDYPNHWIQLPASDFVSCS